MFKHSAVLLTGFSCLSLSIARAQSVSSPQLPPGPMQAKATAACTECHEARIVAQQRLSKATWAKEVDKMIKWGALVDPQDRDALADYLSTNFSVEKPDYAPDRLKTVTKKIVK
jgi:hypothetical protein